MVNWRGVLGFDGNVDLIVRERRRRKRKKKKWEMAKRDKEKGRRRKKRENKKEKMGDKIILKKEYKNIIYIKYNV